MSLPKLSVNRPVTVIMFYMALAVLGAFALSRLAIDLLPKLEPPAISVVTIYPGASAEDVEQKVTKLIEEQVSTINNVSKVTSSSKDNISIITVTFNWGTDIAEATNDIRDAIDRVKRRLPDDAEEPSIFKFSTSTLPVMMIGINSSESYPGINKIIEDKIAQPLRQVPGVGAVFAIGGPYREILIRVDPKKLEAYNLSIPQIAQILNSENLSLPAGIIKVGTKEYSVRVPGEFKSIEEIKSTVIGNYQGALVYLRDVADVIDTIKEQTLYVRINNTPGVLLFIQKQATANTIEVVDAVKKALPKIEKTLPKDVKLNIAFDSSEFIKNSIRNLSNAIVYGGIFVILVVLLFLRKIRASLIIILTIPFSLIVAFITLYLIGGTINLISLASLAIAVGIVVDNAIVVLENITRHIERGENPQTASVIAANEIGLAISASSLTNIAVFLPLAFLTGIAGFLFKELGILVTVMVLTSLLASLTLTPTLSSKWLKGQEKIKNKLLSNLFNTSERWFQAIESFYGNLISWALRHKAIVILTALVLFISSFILFRLVGFEFFPASDTGQIQVIAQLPVGTRIDETIKVGEQLQKIVAEEIPEKWRKYIFMRVGTTEQGFATITGQVEGNNVVTVGARLVPLKERKVTVQELGAKIRERAKLIPGIEKFEISRGSDFQALLFGGGKPLTVEVVGYDLNLTAQVAEKIKEELEKIPGAKDVQIGRSGLTPEIRIEIDKQKASSLGLNTAIIATTIRSSIYGLKATTYKELGDEYDITIRPDADLRNSISYISEIPVRSMSGNIVKIKDIARIYDTFSPIEIQRRDRQRIIPVGANVEGRALGDVVKDLQERISKLDIPPGVEIRFGGQVEEQAKSFRDLFQVLILGIILTYMIMASQFESLLHPFVIMFSVPFAFTGVVLGLLIFGVPFGLTAFMGLIMLVGIVVNNAIVLVDYTNLLRARGYELFNAIVTAGRTRLRPVLMTTLTTILGTLPLAVFKGEGSELWRPLGITMLGGLTFSTLITLVLVPTIYSIFEHKKVEVK
ncbi:hydrophobic/amphiphilic exporter-1, HAE1 family [Candidatus Kryptonium thompsonii]|uniref:Hydrophobic/amphiphilic exporter-1, HAE1 family n=2 Tax=Candidatus Kryptonium thompsonii TaxID=1633631 RepID=A0A0P1M3B2_9BACT|nr:efflux RND transporter permease subunit [Candidatus Kryptonium thompsoni]CUS78390.1 hydrophobic/amphiphilic exporter-1, HAE1 family [Candidatus Kryptonium thompsoni]CUS79095.1 hydrophobic/amphiphilic exporter-1, HAE1 family [Candidatus Kryptonium thompsoni]CUS79859.1 hydrophobic/amphiphilic exporter-1, HAE1 family [Candidatus Kryptonium thompsoni]CUS88572.1 hydrophobic/amphiphilic exporter-1, HAE1 family [Candidatus Kryptonium thompsoni]CUS89220.1 hydrophobic/amphiphilic exporter-1, HAE1 fa